MFRGSKAVTVTGTAAVPVKVGAACIACGAADKPRTNQLYGILCDDAAACGMRYRDGRTPIEYGLALRDGRAPFPRLALAS